MTADDVQVAADVAHEVVVCLDEAVCALLAGREAVAPLAHEQQPLAAAMSAGASFEVTQVILEGAAASAASAELRATPTALTPGVWWAQLQKRGDGWCVTGFRAKP